ncbi:MAG: tryptophan 7-halogenase [Kiloniellaceae bacterium]
MGERIEQVTIVGGGTAGWMTALLLGTYWKAPAEDPESRRITLIESPSVATVGVGEATVPAMPRLLKLAGISERDFFKRCNASFKLGVLFDNWNRDRHGKRVAYINSFNEGPLLGGIDAAHHFLRFGAGGRDFSDVITPALDLGRAAKGPRALGAPEYDEGVGFAYHLDAALFAGLLRDICIGRGVEHLRDDVVDIEKDERGFIAALTLKQRARLPVELVIDCTGFRGVLINQALGEPFVDYSNYLANDRAAAIQIPHPDPKRLEPLTRSTALSSGWVWRVPLYNRVGTGYVFSSAHRGDDEACDELLAHLRATGNDPGKDAQPRVIPMRVGRTRNPWVKNCIAIGLSGGFVEPLESTAIYMIEMSLRWLMAYFPDRDFAPPLCARYNKISTQLYDEVRDFICLHYALGNRTDSQYWIDAREGLDVPDSLAANLALWRHALPTRHDLASASLFSHRVYQAVLLGKKVHETGYADGPPACGVALDRDRWRRYVAQVRQGIEQTVKALPDHKTLLTQLRGEAPAAAAPAAAPAAARAQSAAKAPAGKAPAGQPATVALPGQGAVLKPQISFKQKRR